MRPVQTLSRRRACWKNTAWQAYRRELPMAMLVALVAAAALNAVLFGVLGSARFGLGHALAVVALCLGSSVLLALGPAVAAAGRWPRRERALPLRLPLAGPALAPLQALLRLRK